MFLGLQNVENPSSTVPSTGPLRWHTPCLGGEPAYRLQEGTFTAAPTRGYLHNIKTLLQKAAQGQEKLRDLEDTYVSKFRPFPFSHCRQISFLRRLIFRYSGEDAFLVDSFASHVQLERSLHLFLWRFGLNGTLVVDGDPCRHCHTWPGVIHIFACNNLWRFSTICLLCLKIDFRLHVGTFVERKYTYEGLVEIFSSVDWFSWDLLPHPFSSLRDPNAFDETRFVSSQCSFLFLLKFLRARKCHGKVQVTNHNEI